MPVILKIFFLVWDKVITDDINSTVDASEQKFTLVRINFGINF